MFFFNNLISKKIEGDLYTLKFNGTSQYLQSQSTAEGGLDFTQWSKEQSFTLFMSCDVVQGGPYAMVFSTSKTNHTIKSVTVFFYGNQVRIDIANSSSDRAIIISNVVEAPWDTVQITCNANAVNFEVSIYINGVLENSPVLRSLTGTLEGGDGRLSISRGIYPLNGQVSSVSCVDYVKTLVDIVQENTDKKQSVGTGSWLVAPIEPIYTDGGTRPIKTLSTTNINNPLPNQVAFTNTQGYKFNLINYPTTLTKGIDLIKL